MTSMIRFSLIVAMSSAAYAQGFLNPQVQRALEARTQALNEQAGYIRLANHWGEQYRICVERANRNQSDTTHCNVYRNKADEYRAKAAAVRIPASPYAPASGRMTLDTNRLRQQEQQWSQNTPWNQQQNPQQGGGYGYPQQGGNYGYPQQGGSYGYPQQGGNYGYPQQGDGHGYPQQGGGYGYPQQGGNYGYPQQGGYYPQPGAYPPDQNYHPPIQPNSPQHRVQPLPPVNELLPNPNSGSTRSRVLGIVKQLAQSQF